MSDDDQAILDLLGDETGVEVVRTCVGCGERRGMHPTVGICADCSANMRSHWYSGCAGTCFVGGVNIYRVRCARGRDRG
jgi:hypothetical protein